ncbi:MAG: sel1 repeat family protein, partial [Kiritimatiellales bacterium]|nr:sel1 repeat family protein [Kiritimatiellales bacterium]
VQIEKSNRRKIWVQPDIFCEKDQAFIKNWAVADLFQSKTKLRISAQKRMKGTESDGTDIFYTISLNNNTGFAFEDLEIDYRLYIEEQGFNGNPDSESCVAGKVKITSLPINGKETVQTDPEHLWELFEEVQEVYIETDGYGNSETYTDVSKKKVREDKLTGIWFRITGPAVAGTPVIREFCLPSSLNRRVTWIEEPIARKSATFAGSSRNTRVDPLVAEATRYLKGDGVDRNPAKALELFKEAYDENPTASAALNIGKLYLRNKRLSNYALAEEWMDKVADAGSGRGYNLMALFFSTNRNAPLNDGEKAVKFGLKAVELEGEEDWTLDALACAYARNGQFDLAVENQEKALKKAKSRGSWGVGELAGFKHRLDLFRKGTPWSKN